MNVPSWMYNPWVIIVSALTIVFVATPLVSSLIIKFRALFGDFSGTYLAITVHPRQPILIELAECYHTGSRLSGKIDGVSFAEFENGELVEVQPNTGHYKFGGTVDERLFVLSYHTTIPGAKSSGTLTLQGDSAGRRFVGRWAGYSFEQVSCSPCIWVRIDEKSLSPLTRKTIIKNSEWILAGYGLPQILEEEHDDTETDDSTAQNKTILNGTKDTDHTVMDKFEFPSSRDAGKRIQSLCKQQAIHQKNLNMLEEKAALHGVINVPLELQNEITAIKDRMSEIEQEMAALDKTVS